MNAAEHRAFHAAASLTADRCVLCVVAGLYEEADLDAADRLGDLAWRLTDDGPNTPARVERRTEAMTS